MELMEILHRAKLGIRAFLAREHVLLEVDANERSLSHKLAEYLQAEFQGWNVDCEYNRDVDRVKQLPAPEQTQTDAEDGATIFPDIIVHRRKRPENLLVIEVKKTSNRSQAGTARDAAKLGGLTGGGHYKYACGVHLWIDCELQGIARADVYLAGGRDDLQSDRLLMALMAF
jgi:hypothetical protein